MTVADDLGDLVRWLPKATVRAWRLIAPLVPAEAYLAGGTAITVHLRHRVSHDLDFFVPHPFDPEPLVGRLRSAGAFTPTLVEAGTLNGFFEKTKVQFLDASLQHVLVPVSDFAGIRVAALDDLMATKLKVVQDRGALRDYFDIMRIETHGRITAEEGLRLFVERYRPLAPAAAIAGAVRALGYLDDVEDDPGLPLPRAEIEDYWRVRQPQIIANLGS